MSLKVRPGIARLVCASPRHIHRILMVVIALVLCLPGSTAAIGREPAAAQRGAPVDPTFRHLTVAQGLLHPAVRSVLEDRRGFLWFGTTIGLNRYDSSTMETLASDTDDPAHLHAKFIRGLAED